LFDRDFDAFLNHWCVIRQGTAPDDPLVLVGMITDDRTGRFADGCWIMTSMLLSPLDRVSERLIVRTLNSRYLLGRRLDPHADCPGTRQ